VGLLKFVRRIDADFGELDPPGPRGGEGDCLGHVFWVHRTSVPVLPVVQFSDDVEILLASERAKTAPFGVAGGGEGSRARHVHVTPEGDGIELHSKLAADLKAGSRLLVQPAGGGGYGDPMERPPEAVLADVLDGYVSIGDARDKYGVVIDSDSMTVDEKATTERRRD